MKKSLFIIGVLALSACGNDPIYQLGEKKLSTISQTITVNNASTPTVTAIINIENDKIVDIADNFSYEKFEYSGDQVSKRTKYHGKTISDSIVHTITYTYDDQGRITAVQKAQGKDITTNQTTYLSNQIQSLWINALRHAKSEKYTLTLDGLGNIASEQTSFADNSVPYSGAYEYANGNLTSAKFVYKVNGTSTKDSVKFNYLNKKNELYLKKLMFGKTWRNNSAIENAVNFSPVVDLGWEDFISVYPSISESLIASYSTEEVTVYFNYDFDSAGNLISQVENRFYTNGLQQRVFTNYTYKAFLK